MRTTLGAGLLLASTTLVGVAATPAEAVTGCEDPDTTWTGTPNGSMSWADAANWSHGVPTATSAVCIPYTGAGPEVPSDFDAAADVIDAEGATVTLSGTLTVGTTFDVASLFADAGTLVGGSTTVTESLTGGLTLQGGAELDQWGTAELGDWMAQGSRLTVHGSAELAPGAEIDTLGGLFTIAESGSLTFDSANLSADVTGGFANHGQVTVTAGRLMMMGSFPGYEQPDHFSTGTFTGAPGAEFLVSNTELRTGARLDHVRWVLDITVPTDNTVAIANSTLTDDTIDHPVPSLSGAGELVVTDNSIVRTRIGGALTMTVPMGEVVRMGDTSVQDQARIRVDGELAQIGDINLEDGSVLDIYGTHRAVNGDGFVDFSGTDPGLEVIHPAGQLLADEGSAVLVRTPIVNQGTVDSGTGFIYLGPRAASPSASSGTFRADPAGALYLGSSEEEGHPPFVLDHPVFEGAVRVTGEVVAASAQVRGQLSTQLGGHLGLDGTTSLAHGGSIAGDAVVRGQLETDLGADESAWIEDVEVNGTVHVNSGTLMVLGLAPPGDGTLTGGEWFVAPGAKLDLQRMTTNNAKLILEGPGASLGGFITALDNGPNGTLELRGGVDLSLPGRFRNEGVVQLSPGSRLITGANFRQFATGRLVTEVDATGLGRVRAEGRRDLAGELVIQRDPSYTPPVDTVMTFLASNGRADPDDAFDSVVSPLYGASGTRQLGVAYERDHVRLWVDRVG